MVLLRYIRSPGEFRKTQNWIGSSGSTLAQATFVPPPVVEMHNALNNLEQFLHQQDLLPALILSIVAIATYIVE
jgi:Fic family protein